MICTGNRLSIPRLAACIFLEAWSGVDDEKSSDFLRICSVEGETHVSAQRKTANNCFDSMAAGFIQNGADVFDVSIGVDDTEPVWACMSGLPKSTVRVRVGVASSLSPTTLNSLDHRIACRVLLTIVIQTMVMDLWRLELDFKSRVRFHLHCANPSRLIQIQLPPTKSLSSPDIRRCTESESNGAGSNSRSAQIWNVPRTK
ncbi:uncharacterized protein RCC_05155 [Ramularia collo-cygni]|uniref:Uncharacterized protein n=1 Tax=Ramularia collo-cygni TaxID=112498 RepID=A0A2D3UVJ9_9PEZI|nr:uncharacterized protein RCC_05155 [Ramularia collo-cygni]CZT19308.1 uncharacterized protein RCC_05155 [Ramularia collo-cygni]